MDVKSQRTIEHARPMKALSGFERDTLAIIGRLDGADGPVIRSRLEAAYEERINDSRLYPTLGRLTEAGLVEKSRTDGPEKHYALTPEGRARVDADRQWRTADA